MRAVLAGGPFVPRDAVGQTLGLVGDVALLFGQALGVFAPMGAVFQVLFLADEALDVLDVLLDPGLFAGQAFGPLLAHEQFQQLVQIGNQFALLVDGRGQAFFFQGFQDAAELAFDVPLAAFPDCLAEQLGSNRVLVGQVLGHPQQHFAEAAIFGLDALLVLVNLFAQLVDRGGLLLPLGFLGHQRLGEEHQAQQGRQRQQANSGEHGRCLPERGR